MTAPAPLDRANIETIHPLTPVQRSLLYASLHGRRNGVDPGFLQTRFRLEGRLVDDAFEAAWQRAFERHTALRSSIHWKNVDHPLQVVSRQLRPISTREDLSSLGAEAAERRIAEWTRQDRANPIDPSRPPLFRLATFRTAHDRWHLVLTSHHVILDGWSCITLIDEVLELHDAIVNGREPALAPARPFAEYVAWLGRQDMREAESFWRSYLAAAGEHARDFRTPSDLRNGTRSHATREIGQASTERLREFARHERLTPGTLIQTAWALVLAARNDRADVCFGTTVSGRAAPIDGIDSMIGTFTGALPVRIRLDPETSLADTARSVQQNSMSLQRYEYTPPDRIQAWSGLPGHQRVFDSLLVFENLPLAPSADRALRVADVSGEVTSNAAVTLMVVPGTTLRFTLLHESVVTDAEARGLLDAMESTLDRLADRSTDSVRGAIAAIAHSARTAPSPQPSAPDPAASEDELPASLDPFEFQLVQIFEGVLGRRDLGVDDDFFDAGGHSLVALDLFDRIEKVFGRRLPLATIFEAATPRALAARLSAEGWRAPWNSLVAMQPMGSVAPLFCVHSYEGHILHYRDLARSLAPNQPVYGLQSLGMNGAVQPLSTVVAMAEAYLAEIRNVQPAGPYSIAAICFGIAVAFEMAHRLVAEGETVARLFILDSGFHQLLPMPPRPEASALAHAGQRVSARVRGLNTRARHVIRSLRETENERRARRVREANERAWTAYQPRPYPGAITLIRSAGYASRQDWHVEMWSGLGESLETIIVPGDHRTLMREPNVRHLADCIRNCLALATPV